MKVDAADQARTSFADFYQQYKNLIFKKAHEMANDPDYVEDLVQDTMYQILRREELFLSLSEAQQVDYCMKTIRNTTINHHKRNQKIRFLSENILDEQCPSSPTLEEGITECIVFRPDHDISTSVTWSNSVIAKYELSALIKGWEYEFPLEIAIPKPPTQD